jgi:uncharacterized membrane protein
MAGIGFELRKTLNEKRLGSFIKMYSYAGILSAGPWVTSILVILFVGFIGASSANVNSALIVQQVMVIYGSVLALSLIITAPFILSFTRFTADLIFRNEADKLLANFFGVLVVLLSLSFIFAVPFFKLVFPEQDAFFLLTVLGLFTSLCAIWLANVLAESLKFFKVILFSYMFAYGGIAIGAYFFAQSLNELMFVFFMGNLALILMLAMTIMVSFPSNYILLFDFFNVKIFYFSLAISGFFYTSGIWIDKIIFWYHPLTGQSVIGTINFSILYDIPIFLAQLSILPGMAIFFFRLESDFADSYDDYFESIRSGASLKVIETFRLKMKAVATSAINEIILIQVIIIFLLYLSTPSIFGFFGISFLYIPLFNILLVGALLQLGFMSILALLYYLNRLRYAMWLSIAFFLLNAALTLMTISLGPSYFGYGYTVSLLIVFFISIVIIQRVLERLSYETFMLQ